VVRVGKTHLVHHFSANPAINKPWKFAKKSGLIAVEKEWVFTPPCKLSNLNQGIAVRACTWDRLD